MTLPTLDFDVLLMIQAVADQASISRMMQTCHLLYEAGEKVILQNVSMSSGEQFESFGRFVTTGRIYRISLLHSLTLDMRHASTSSGTALKRLFLQLFPHPNLVRLSLRDPERLLSIIPGLSTAIAALTSVKYLAISCTGPYTIAMLRAMRSHLLVVELSTLNTGHSQEPGALYNGVRCDVTSLFHNSQSSLQELRASWPDRTPLDPHAHQDPSTALVDGPRFRRMRTLVLENPYMLAITDYIRTYPNLRSLTIQDMSDNLFREEDTDYREQRDMNIFHQKTYGTWTTLRRFHGSILVLYVLGLTCRIPWISVDNFDHNANGSLLHAVLLDNRPAHLELRLLSIGSFRKTYASVLQTAPAAGALRSLTLTIMLSCQDIEMDLATFLKTVQRVAKSLSISTFELCIDCSREVVRASCLHPDPTRCRADYYRRAIASYRFPVERQLDSLDLREVARDIKKKALCVHRVVIRVRNLHLRKDNVVALGEPVDYGGDGEEMVSQTLKTF